jgi:hypothetical protein
MGFAFNRLRERTDDPYSKLEPGRGFFMVIHFFRNRWHRRYFQLLDVFNQERCSLCCLLSQKEAVIIKRLLASHNPRKRRGISLKTLCVLHRSRIKEALADDPSFFNLIKKVLAVSLRELAHPPKAPPPAWKRWLRVPLVRCPMCRRLVWEEKNLCRALVQFLDDVEFWKGLQKAPLLCLDHFEKCLAVRGNGKGFERLLKDQSAKLNHLLNELVRFEATGTHEDSKLTALNWLAGFAGTGANGEGLCVSAEEDLANDLLSVQHSDGPAGDGQDPEELLFENEKLKKKVRDLIQHLNEVETRAASLHYRCAELSETNKKLEMGYTGASTQARGLAKLVQDLRAELKRLEEGKIDSHAKAVS